MTVRQLLFKRINMLKGRVHGLGFVFHFDVIFQIIPAVAVDRHMPRSRKTIPERGEERLLPRVFRNPCRSIDMETAGIHILHHLADDFAAAGIAPAFKDHDDRHAGIPGGTLCFAQLISQLVVQQLFQFRFFQLGIQIDFF